MSRNMKFYLPAIIALVIGLMVQDRETALFGAMAAMLAGTVCGIALFGFNSVRRTPIRFFVSGLGLFVLTLAIGLLVPSTLGAVIAFPLLALLSVSQFGLVTGKFALVVVNQAASTPGFNRLVETCRNKDITIVNLREKARTLPLTVGEGAHVIVAGNVAPDALHALCHRLRKQGFFPVIAKDAIEPSAELIESLRELNEELFQIVVAGEVPALLSAKQLKVYAFAKGDSTTTTAVVLKKSRRALMIKRDRDPYKDMDSLPGGFLNIHLESLADCAAREVMEECFVNRDTTPGAARFTHEVRGSDMVLVDVRSEPERDWRGHVVDHGYAWFVPEELEETVIANVSAGDDAKAGSARFVSIDEALANPMAFDHGELLAAVARTI